MLKFIPQDVITKLKSDRMWAMLLYVALLVANAKFNLGINDAQMTEVLYAVIAFILGKSVRGSEAGSLIASLVPTLTTATETLVDGDDPADKKKRKRDKAAE